MNNNNLALEGLQVALDAAERQAEGRRRAVEDYRDSLLIAIQKSAEARTKVAQFKAAIAAVEANGSDEEV